jgi:DNA-binding NarL/FixJ family response regulator
MAEERTITIMVVDDHPIVRQGLVGILEDEPDFRVVGAIASVTEALQLAERARPDVILLDLELPKLDGIAALPQLATASPASRVIIFTAYDNDERIFGAIEAGAKGYLLKGAPTEEIARAIRTVHGGGSHLASRVAARVVNLLSTPQRAHDRLSGREREVLLLIAAGRSNKEIGHELTISERTARFHVTSILTKLGATTRAQAVALAGQRGLL